MKHPLSACLTLCMLALASTTVCAQSPTSGTTVTGVAIEQLSQPAAPAAQDTPPPARQVLVLPRTIEGNAVPVADKTPAVATVPVANSAPVATPTPPVNPSPVENPTSVVNAASASNAVQNTPATPYQPADPTTAATAAAAAPAEETSEKFAFILPQKGSRFDAVSQYALDGVLAANYATEKPAQILLIRPGSDNSVAEQLRKAAEAGAMAAIGPLDREAIEQIAALDFLPLPVITLNQVDLDTEIALTPEEIEQRQIELEARRMADQAARELNAGTQLQGFVLNPAAPTTTPAQVSTADSASQVAPTTNSQTAGTMPPANQQPTTPSATTQNAVVTVQAPSGLVRPLSLIPGTALATASTPVTPATSSTVDGTPIPLATIPAVDAAQPLPGTPGATQVAPSAQQAAAGQSPTVPAAPQSATQPDNGIEVSIASDLKVPGLVLAEDVPVPAVRYEPRLFPRNLLMMGLSMETDAEYVAELGLQALPRLTESGERPKVLILDQDRPLQKKISAAFCKVLTEHGFAPDRLTIDLKNLNRITQFFELVVEDDDPEIEPEEPIDQEADPVAWRQQQLRQRRESAEKRAQAAFAEPPYYAVFMALDASTASQIRPRLPIRTRVWGTPFLYPGNPMTNPSAKALTYDLKQVGFVESPFILNFDETKFEETYKVAAPNNLVGKRLFSLGADAYSVAKSLARGQVSGTIEGLTGSLTFDLETSPIVGRRGTCAMIANGSIRVLPAQELIDYHVIAPGTRYLPKNHEKTARTATDSDKTAE